MKWTNGETWEHKRDRLEMWHDWFAWFPVKVGVTEGGHWIKVWLETVERKGKYWFFDRRCDDWEYREKAKAK